MGNGYPVAAICGKREVMEVVGPHKVVHGGTFSSNPVSLSAVKATLKELSRPMLWKHLRWYGRHMMSGVHEALDAHGFDYLVQGFPAMFQVMFTKRHAVKEYRELRDCDYNLYAYFHFELLKHGIMIDNNQLEVIFTSASHDKADLEKTITCLEHAAKGARTPRSMTGFELRQKRKGLRGGGAI
jgi:glutamate-1-semialdehyde 2,1-aminomutase